MNISNPIFLSVSGSHLYGIPNPSDLDLRGVFTLSKEDYIKLGTRKETVEKTIANDVDIVWQELGKYLGLLIKPNVNMIEHALSPLNIMAGHGFKEIQHIARDCVSKACYSHWKGFAKHTSYHAVQEDYKKAKRNLYLLRIYYQGLHVLENLKLKSDFDSFRNIDMFNDELVEELFDCKRRKAPFHNKQAFLSHCGDLEKVLAERLEKSDLRDAPTKETKDQAGNLYQNLVEEYWK